jgi:hypothetical protein
MYSCLCVPRTHTHVPPRHTSFYQAIFQGSMSSLGSVALPLMSQDILEETVEEE